MGVVSIKEMVPLFNKSWPQCWQAELLNTNVITRKPSTDLEEKVIDVMKITPINARNKDFVPNVVFYRGAYPSYDQDFYTVEINTHFGTVSKADDKTLNRLCDYIFIRMEDLKKYLDNFDNLYPVEWGREIRIKPNNETDYKIIGSATIPFDAIGPDKDLADLDELNKILLEGFYLGEHPNDIDSYLQLNESGVISDTFTLSH